MRFTNIIHDLKELIDNNKGLLLSISNEYRLYSELMRLTNIVGERYNIVLQQSFPYRDRIKDYESYGRENISIIIDKHTKRFPIDREEIKKKAREIFENADVRDAYMYEGREGVKIFLGRERIDILPGSLHIWCKIDEKVEEFCNWLLENCYKS